MTDITVYIGAVLAPLKFDEGDEWKANYPDLAENVTLPLIICGQTAVTDKVDERTESKFEETALELMKTVDVNGIHICIHDEKGYLLDYDLTPEQQNGFLPLLEQQQLICIEYRFHLVNKSSSKPELIFAIGSVWDNKSKSWAYEPFSKTSIFWK
ncbi:MAG: hypothetical protein Q7R33_04255 [Nitrosarchaeum sp.]|nr:hypothetical protein [Nitrosarchaeum sp.]